MHNQLQYHIEIHRLKTELITLQGISSVLVSQLYSQGENGDEVASWYEYQQVKKAHLQLSFWHCTPLS